MIRGIAHAEDGFLRGCRATWYRSHLTWYRPQNFVVSPTLDSWYRPQNFVVSPTLDSWYRPQNFVVSPTPHSDKPLFHGRFRRIFTPVTGRNTLINLLTQVYQPPRHQELAKTTAHQPTKVARGYRPGQFQEPLRPTNSNRRKALAIHRPVTVAPGARVSAALRSRCARLRPCTAR
jgi:hypothetical protein